MEETAQIKDSFRDPAGYIFVKDGVLYRHINPEYQTRYNYLMKSGLYLKLVSEKLLIPHLEITEDIIRPQLIPFISYPYEWCFSQIKDAASITLKIQEIALDFGMTLKDASAYNIQFIDGKPILIDTLSFEIWNKEPWIPYEQFCRHFLCPLVLISYVDSRLNRLMREHIDGIPLNLAIHILSKRGMFDPRLFTHLYLHNLTMSGFKERGKRPTMSLIQLKGFIKNLESTIKSIKWKDAGFWAKYMLETSYTKEAVKSKLNLVEEYSKCMTGMTWDLGSNKGDFSSLFTNTVSIDSSPVCTELDYLRHKGNLPLTIDLTNPSPAIGWNNEERMTLAQRGKPDNILALALIHHLLISNNISFPSMSRFFGSLCKNLIIEFVPAEDRQAKRLLLGRDFTYTMEDFEKAFTNDFRVVRKDKIKDSIRTLYWMAKK